MHLVRIVYRKYYGWKFNKEKADLIQSGMIGLMDAARKFTPEKGVKFKTYAPMRIFGSMKDYLRSLENKGQRRKHVRLRGGEIKQTFSLTQYDNDDDSHQIDVNIDRETISDYESKIKELRISFTLFLKRSGYSRRISEIAVKYFFDRMKLSKIGLEYNLSESRISRLLRGIREKSEDFFTQYKNT